MSYNKQTAMWEGYIYCATNLVNGKKYIGQTRVTIEHRMKQHELYHPKNQARLAFHMAIKKYGINNFKVEELEKVSCCTKEELTSILDEKEIFYIKMLNSLTSGHGYNIDAGGKSGTIFCVPIDVYDLEGNYIRSFDSIVDASRYYQIGRGTINKMCLGEIHRSYKHNFIFRYKGEDFDKYDTSMAFGGCRKVYQFTLDGNLVNEYPSITYAERVMSNNENTNTTLIAHVVSKNQMAYGYVWSYDNDFRFDTNNYRNLTPVDKYSKDGEFLCSYISIRSALKDIGKSITCSTPIQNACSGKLVSAYGYIWRYKGESFDKYRTEPKQRGIAVNQYSKDNKYINTFDSAKNASILLNYNQGDSSIIKCCKGKLNTAYGFKWFYADDPNQPDKSKIITSNVA